jgi:hypothetical protein
MGGQVTKEARGPMAGGPKGVPDAIRLTQAIHWGRGCSISSIS